MVLGSFDRGLGEADDWDLGLQSGEQVGEDCFWALWRTRI
jgi:hypothetical protein